jgi:hypothetical protein
VTHGRPSPRYRRRPRRVAELHAQGLSRNAIATDLGRSGRTISRICVEHDPPLTFERTRTAAATAAKKADGAARRAQLQLEALDSAARLMGQMFSPTKVYNFGGKENDYNERDARRAAVPRQARHRHRHPGAREHRAQARRVRQGHRARGREVHARRPARPAAAARDGRRARTPREIDLRGLAMSEKQIDYVLDSDAFVNLAEGSVRSGKTISGLLRWLQVHRQGRTQVRRPGRLRQDVRHRGGTSSTRCSDAGRLRPLAKATSTPAARPPRRSSAAGRGHHLQRRALRVPPARHDLRRRTSTSGR